MLVLAVLWGLWEGWHWVGTHFALTWPFPVNDVTMPHLHRIVRGPLPAGAGQRPAADHDPLARALFTAKEALLGFALGAVFGFAIAVLLSQSRWIERGVIPYVVASQTVPLLAIAPMVVVGLGSKGVDGLGLGRDPRRVPDLLPGHDQHRCAASARPTRARSS